MTWTPRRRSVGPPPGADRGLVPIRISNTAVIVIVWNQFLVAGLLVYKWMDGIRGIGCPDWNLQCAPPPSFYWWKVVLGWVAGNLVLVVLLAVRRRLRKDRRPPDSADPAIAS